jgi:hypothetical protein
VSFALQSVKILVSGTFSTGKTTFDQDLRTELGRRGVSCVATVEASRSCLFPLNKRQDLAGSLWLFGECVRNESLAAAEGARVIVCDGGPPDSLRVDDEGYREFIDARSAHLWERLGVQLVARVLFRFVVQVLAGRHWGHLVATTVQRGNAPKVVHKAVAEADQLDAARRQFAQCGSVQVMPSFASSSLSERNRDR